MLYTLEYQQLLREEHARRPWGHVGHTHSDRVLAVSDQYHCQTILDYGCGQGLLSQKIGQLIPVYNYDPGRSEYSALPAPADLVVCVDVLEHIEPHCLDTVLAHIQSLTQVVAYFTVTSIPARSTFPDGRNLHLIQQPTSWWLTKLSQYFTLALVEDNLVIATKNPS